MDNNLSAGESAIYDRQIRLWGSNAQMRIKSSKILVIGLTPITVEMTKNLVLAGSSVTLVDDRTVTDASNNFLIKLEVDDPRSMTVGQATALAACRLNEHSKVNSVEGSEILGDDCLDSFNVVIVSLSYLDFDLLEAIRLSNETRSRRKAFFMIVDSVSVPFAFSDFGGDHVVEELTPPMKPTSRIEKEKHKIELFEFSSFSKFIENIQLSAKFKNIELLLIHSLLAFLSEQKREPESKRAKRNEGGSPVGRIPSLDEFLKFLELKGIRNNLNQFEEFYENLNKTSLPHIAAIHASLVTQEVIKYITKRDPPLVNQIFMEMKNCAAIVSKLPASLSTRVLVEGEGDVEVVNDVGLELE